MTDWVSGLSRSGRWCWRWQRWHEGVRQGGAAGVAYTGTGQGEAVATVAVIGLLP